MLWHVPINLDELSVVNVRAKSIFYGIQIGSMAVCRELDPDAQPSSQVVYKVVCGPTVARSDIPAGDELGFSIQGRPRPNVAPSLAFLFWRGVLFLQFVPKANMLERSRFVDSFIPVCVIK